MTKKINTEKLNIEYYSNAIKNTANKDFISFFKWFNGGVNINEIINNGYRDFFHSILKPYIFEQTKKKSKEQVCLEIGCGGGRILNAACKYFGKAIGVDIHDSFAMLKSFMNIENTNYEVFKVEKNKIPIAEKTIDFVYSFIVFQHILKIEVFAKYLSEIKRILKADGTIIIYFGRPRLLSKKNLKNKTLNFITVLFDRIFYEELFINVFRRGYYEDYKAKVNHVNLVVSKRKAKKLFRNSDLKIIEIGHSQKGKIYGTQYYFIAKHK